MESIEIDGGRDLSGKNMSFVGGSGGIGLAAATAMAKQGASILLVGRNRIKADRALRILRDAGAEDAEWLEADISSIAGMRRAAEGMGAWKPVLHGLVHSASAVVGRKTLTEDGLETYFATMYLARHAINAQLLGRLAASGDGRIVQVSGKPLLPTFPDLGDLQFERRRWTMLKAVFAAHVLEFLDVQKLGELCAGIPVSASIACVGATRADPPSDQAIWIRLLYKLIASAPEESAANTARLLLYDDARFANGCAFFDPRRFAASRLASIETQWNAHGESRRDYWAGIHRLKAELEFPRYGSRVVEVGGVDPPASGILPSASGPGKALSAPSLALRPHFVLK